MRSVVRTIDLSPFGECACVRSGTVDGCGRDHHVFCETSSDWILVFFFEDTDKGGAQLLRMSVRRETERGRSQRSFTQTDGMPQAVEVTPTLKLGERKSPFVVAAQAKKGSSEWRPPKWWDALKERCVATLCGQGELLALCALTW